MMMCHILVLIAIFLVSLENVHVQVYAASDTDELLSCNRLRNLAEHEDSIYSQYGEDGVLLALLDILGLENSRYVHNDIHRRTAMNIYTALPILTLLPFFLFLFVFDLQKSNICRIWC